MESSLGMEWGIVERNIELGGVMRAKWGGGRRREWGTDERH